jgi:hypothetical protein
MNDAAKAATEDTRKLTDDELRARIIQRAFGGDASRYARFTAALREALPDDVTVVLRGSAVIGVRWEDGAPFDADGPCTSDLDITLVGGDMLKLWDESAFYIPKLHTAPLNDETPDSCPSLVPLRRALCTIAGRPVNIQATASFIQYVRDVLFDQPYFTLVEGTKEPEDDDAAAQLAGGPVLDRASAERTETPRGRRADPAGGEAHA